MGRRFDDVVAILGVGTSLVIAGAAAAQDRLRAHLPLVIEAESLVDRAVVRGGAITQQDMRGFGSGWGGDAQLFWRPTDPVDAPVRNWPSLTLSFEIPRGGDFAMALHHSAAADYGRVRLLLDGVAVGEFDGWGASVEPRQLDLGQRSLSAGTHELVLTVFGRSPSSSGFLVGLDRLVLSPMTAAGAVPSGAGPETSVTVEGGVHTFAPPVVDGRRVDRCLHWGRQCEGRSAAAAFCRLQGLGRPAGWRFADDIGATTPTLVLGDGAICDQASCDGYAMIGCLEPASGRVREEILLVDESTARLAWARSSADTDELYVGPPTEIPPGIPYTGNFDQRNGDELIQYQAAEGDYHLVSFDPQSGAAQARWVVDALPFGPERWRVAGRFIVDGTFGLLGYIPGLDGDVAHFPDGHLAWAEVSLLNARGVAFPADVTGDQRDEAIFVDESGAIAVALFGDWTTSGNDNHLDATVVKAAGADAPGAEFAVGDFDGDGAQELLAVARPTGEVSLLRFDGLGRFAERKQIATEWPGTRTWNRACDHDGDGADDLFVRDTASGEAGLARLEATGELRVRSLGGGFDDVFTTCGYVLDTQRASVVVLRRTPGGTASLTLLAFDAEGGLAPYSALTDGLPELAIAFAGDFYPSH